MWQLFLDSFIRPGKTVAFWQGPVLHQFSIRILTDRMMHVEMKTTIDYTVAYPVGIGVSWDWLHSGIHHS